MLQHHFILGMLFTIAPFSLTLTYVVIEGVLTISPMIESIFDQDPAMIQDWSYCVIVCYFLLNVVVTILHFRRENLKSYSNSLLLIIQSLLMLSSIGLTIWTLTLVDDYDHEKGRDTFFSSDSLRRTMLIIEVNPQSDDLVNF